jgi:hypothetical protein
MSVASRDISVVVQGPVVGTSRDPEDRRQTRRCLASVRAFLPDAEIILSTWRGSDVAGLAFDVLVENDDPGAVRYEDLPHILNNVNRQILTSWRGLQVASRPYALKLRSDMEMRHLGFLSYFGRFPERCAWSFLRGKVVSSTLYARIPGLVFEWPYHPGDWFFFGETDDVRSIWQIPLAAEPDLTRWFNDRPRPANDASPQSMLRYTPEQFIWLSFLRKHRDVACAYQWDLTDEAILGTEQSFAGNLILVSPDRAGLVLPKYPTPSSLAAWAEGPATCYSHALWKHLYFKHCLGRRYTWRALAWSGPYVAVLLHRLRHYPVRLRQEAERSLRALWRIASGDKKADRR